MTNPWIELLAMVVIFGGGVVVVGLVLNAFFNMRNKP